MKINQIQKLIIIVISIFVSDICKASNLNLATKTSTIQVKSGAVLTVDTEISAVTGTIIQDTGATIEGQDISFSDGKFQESQNKIVLDGTLTPGVDSKITLDGNKIFRGQQGSSLKAINVRNKNNKIEGDISIENDITLLDSNTSLSVNLICSLKSNLNLNGGELYIHQDNLQFSDSKRIFGPGKIYVNENKLIFGARPLTFEEPLYFSNAQDIQFNDNVTLNSCLTFSGNATVEGHLNVIDMSDSGKIIIERGSSLLMKNIILYNVNTDNLFCMDNAGTLTLQNVKLYQSSDYTFSLGKLAFADKVEIFGSNNFTYNSQKQSTILSKSTLCFDEGMTFSYDPGNMRKDLILFQDEYSCLQLNGASLHATLTGMQLTKGYLLINQNSFLSSEKTNFVDEGITFGNDSLADDFYCEILKGSKLEVTSGSLKNRNIASNAWYMENGMSCLELNASCNLYLYQNLNIEPGYLNYKGRGGFFCAPGKTLIGSLNVRGYLDYRTLS